MPKKNDQAITPVNKQALIKVRNRIDAIDQQLLSLLQERLGCAKKVGQIKSKDDMPKWDPKRERQIFESLHKANAGVFPEQSLDSIFQEIITTCRLSQKKVEVAYLGPEATFSNLAGVEHFGHSADFRPMETIEDVFIEIERDRVHYGIVPVENSIEGAVTSTLDSFMNYNVKICGELNLCISHHLVNQSGDINDIKKVISHSQPLAQCRQWLKKNLPEVKTQTVFSTALASMMAAEDPSLAAIASSMAVKTYHLHTVVKGLEDYSGNTTRFLLIGQSSPSRSGCDKTSLLVGLIDRPGALHNSLSILAKHDINLTRIESRPLKGEAGKYLFFLDMEGHMEDENIKAGCQQLKQVCSSYVWLGSYPRSKT
ncbi:MAG: prephenate dehydratase [Desulfobulbaceae bacterium]|nr:prephenate dehydratase [Desulfobulbaceae bacterium]